MLKPGGYVYIKSGMFTKFTDIPKILREEIKGWFEYFFIRNLPGRTGRFLRRIYWSTKFSKCISLSLSHGCIITAPENIEIGEKVNIMHNCCLYAHNSGSIKIGDRVSINSNAMLGAADGGEIVIENDVLIGPNVVIRASNHQYLRKDISINRQGHTGGKITIEDDVWIGANVVLLPDIVIGKGTVIGAGSVVNKNIPPYVLAGGIPVKVIKENIRIENNI